MKTAPYGSWPSPIKPDTLTKGHVYPSEPSLDGDEVYWLELRPDEGGRYAVCVRRGRHNSEAVPKSFNARTRVHEYGGGSYLASHGVVFFSNFADQRVYRAARDEGPVSITQEGVRYADYVMDATRSRLIGVSEDHRVKGRLPTNGISSIAVDGSGTSLLLSGRDFYSSPRLDPSGTRLAWLSWDFPNMPWDGTELWVGEIRRDGTIGKKSRVAGDRQESIMQPEWSPSGVLHFASDRTGFWNLYRLSDGRPEQLTKKNADFSEPQWTFRRSMYGFASDRRIVAAFTKNGIWRLGTLDTESRMLDTFDLPFTEMSYVAVGRGRAIFRAASPKIAPIIVSLDLKDGSWEVVCEAKGPEIDGDNISVPRHISFETKGGKKAYGFFYRPRNKSYRGPRGTRPPLIIEIHGGPTSSTHTALSLEYQAWTTRGFAILDVNYGGSTGYGREYWKRLEGEWGVVDVDDCVNGALHLAKMGEVDRRKLIIRGGSAGGYTTLAALAFSKVFGAGASYFGVSDVEALAKYTHKFESRYMDKLVGPYPKEKKLYRDRSPIYHADRISAPVIFFQGMEDKIVLPDQAEKMVNSLRKRGVPVAYLAFEGEQHGFRRASSIKRTFEAELYFYSKVFGFPLTEKVRPVKIDNLKR